MFDVEMDVSLTFDPPMDADGPGITVTRRFQLPFVPQKGIALTGQAFNDHPDPEGLVLQDVVWDDDRRVFLVDSAGSMHDFPIAIIPDELRLWIERGWRLGSYRDAYVQEEDDSAGCDSEAEDNDPALSDTANDEWEDLEKLPTMSPRRRPRDG